MSALSKKIDEIVNNTGGEPDLYPYFKELLSRSTFGIGLTQAQIVVDTSMAKGRQRPDLTLYRTDGPKVLKTPDHAFAVVEIKKGSALAANGKGIVKEKRAYVQPGTRWFFLADQDEVWRIDAADRAAFKLALDTRGPIPTTLLTKWSWSDLKDPDTFHQCFGCVSAEALQLDNELKAFRAGKTPVATLDATGDGKELFAATVRNASETIRGAVENILARQGTEHLKEALAEIAKLSETYGEPIYDWSNERRPIEFAKMWDSKAVAQLTDEQVTNYDEQLVRLMQSLSQTIYALRIEKELLPKYAERQGEDSASLLSTEKKSKQIVASLVYETASLMLSRMLTIRFCEDYGLFTTRYISNGGIEVFWRFAEHFDLPMQELLRQTYRHGSSIFASIFDASLLDWAVGRNEAELSAALEQAAYVLSRWNFATVRGDILSGVYDQYLDVSQRRRLGEVYTRPEIARFMLRAAGWTPEKTLMDPSCGTGTFLVEALGQRLEALKAAGAVSVSAVHQIISRLVGLDISSFSVTLAQIQVFWRLIDVLAGKNADEVREFAKEILPALKFHGGWTSLDTFGMPLGTEAGAAQSGLAFRIARAEAGRARGMVPAGFEGASQGEYDIVIMNPPYVRAERSGGTGGGSAYSEVTYRNTDTAVFFIYRALKQWVKPGGKLAFIVPIGITEAAYAGRLRRVIGAHRITMIADLEGLGKATFRGVKRATVIMVIEKAPSCPDDDVEMLQLDPTCLQNDIVDFTRATRTVVKRSDIDRSRYLPGGVVDEAQDEPGTGPAPSIEPAEPEQTDTTAPVWISAMRGEESSGEAFITKLRDGDADALRTMRDLPRLGELVRVVYVRRARGEVTTVSDTLPKTEAYAYRPELLFNYGVKLGGKSAMKQPGDTDCVSIYKGQNIFSQGLIGAPMGEWSPTAKRENTRYIYTYHTQLTYNSTYAIREISQLPTAAPVSAGMALQNTAYLVELIEDYPLHILMLSRLIQFYASRVLRSSIIEDFGCHWYKRTLTLLPITRSRAAEDIAELREAGDAVLAADSDLADRYREIDAAIAAGRAGAATIEALIVNGHPDAQGVDLNQVAESGTVVTQIIEAGDNLNSNDLFFTAKIPHAAIRYYVKFTLERRIEAKPEEPITRADILEIEIPTNLDTVVDAILGLSNDDLTATHLAALDRLDAVVARQCGINDDIRDHMIAAMQSDAILSKMRPMTAQRGLRIQAYADHSDGDRYD